MHAKPTRTNGWEPSLQPDRIISFKEYRQILNKSRAMVYLMLNPGSKYYRPNMPKKLKTGDRSVGFSLLETMAYIDALKASREEEGGAK